MQGVFVWPGLSFDFFDRLIDWLIDIHSDDARITAHQLSAETDQQTAEE